AAEHSQEHLAGQVLWFGGALNPQVAGYRRGEIVVEARESPRRASARRVYDLGKRFAQRQCGPPGAVITLVIVWTPEQGYGSSNRSWNGRSGDGLALSVDEGARPRWGTAADGTQVRAGRGQGAACRTSQWRRLGDLNPGWASTQT